MMFLNNQMAYHLMQFGSCNLIGLDSDFQDSFLYVPILQKIDEKIVKEMLFLPSTSPFGNPSILIKKRCSAEGFV